MNLVSVMSRRSSDGDRFITICIENQRDGSDQSIKDVKEVANYIFDNYASDIVEQRFIDKVVTESFVDNIVTTLYLYEDAEDDYQDQLAMGLKLKFS